MHSYNVNNHLQILSNIQSDLINNKIVVNTVVDSSFKVKVLGRMNSDSPVYGSTWHDDLKYGTHCVCGSSIQILSNRVGKIKWSV